MDPAHAAVSPWITADFLALIALWAGSISSAFGIGCVFTDWRHKERSRHAKIDERLRSVEAQLQMRTLVDLPTGTRDLVQKNPLTLTTSPSQPVSAGATQLSTSSDVIPIRDNVHTPSLSEERRPKPGLIGDVYFKSAEERATAEIAQRQIQTQRSMTELSETARRFLIHLPLESSNENPLADRDLSATSDQLTSRSVRM